MVVKLIVAAVACERSFESRVILDGSQTGNSTCQTRPMFESRVILDGSQTVRRFGTKKK